MSCSHSVSTSSKFGILVSNALHHVGCEWINIRPSSLYWPSLLSTPSHSNLCTDILQDFKMPPRSRLKSRERQLQSDKANMISLTEVIQQIQQDWDFMTDEKCVPVQVALNLMDSSSLGRAHQYDQFQATHKQLQRALKAIVNGRLPFYLSRAFVHHFKIISDIVRLHPPRTSPRVQ